VTDDIPENTTVGKYVQAVLVGDMLHELLEDAGELLVTHEDRRFDHHAPLAEK
jgi:hypothetical protein